MANVDVTSTILDETDVAPGRVQDGRSLLELLADPGAEWGRDILIENGNGANGVPTYRGIRNYRFLYVEHRTTGRDRALRPGRTTRSSCRASTGTPRTRRCSATSTRGCAHWCTAWAWTARPGPT